MGDFPPRIAARVEGVGDLGRRARPRARTLLLLASSAIVLVAVVLPRAGAVGNGEPARLAWFSAGLLSLVLVLVVKHAAGLDWLSPAVVYGLVFWLFHFGLVFPASLVPRLLDRFEPWSVSWAYSPEAGKAALLAALFSSAFLLGFMMLAAREGETLPQRASHSTRARELEVCGWIVIGAGLLLEAISTIRYGPSVFFAGYGDFFPIHGDFSGAVILTAYGLALHLAGGRSVRATLWTASWSFMPIALLTFVAGSRTAPVVGVIVVAMVAARRGALRLHAGAIVVASALALSVIGLVQVTRVYGLSQVPTSFSYAAAINPMRGMSELGGSLRPVAMAVDYIDVEGSNLFYGQTYSYPFVRIAERALGTSREDPDDEPRFIAVHMGTLYGEGMGYSVVAEAYVNGGSWGVLVAATAWGVLLAGLMRRPGTPYGLGLLAAVMLPMLVSIRNSFIFVPAWVGGGLLLLGVARYLIRPLLSTAPDPR